jgi:hypothetical protein
VGRDSFIVLNRICNQILAIVDESEADQQESDDSKNTSEKETDRCSKNFSHNLLKARSSHIAIMIVPNSFLSWIKTHRFL